jgi:hypothetical protein
MDKRSKDEGEAAAGLQSRYDEALLSANWNPVIDLLGASGPRTRDDTSRLPSPRGAAEEDPDGFLRRVYSFGN